MYPYIYTYTYMCSVCIYTLRIQNILMGVFSPRIRLTNVWIQLFDSFVDVNRAWAIIHLYFIMAELEKLQLVKFFQNVLKIISDRCIWIYQQTWWHERSMLIALSLFSRSRSSFIFASRFRSNWRSTASNVFLMVFWHDFMFSTSAFKEFSGLSLTRSMP